MTEQHAPAKTPLYQEHIACGGKMVDFAGWLMPVNYGSQIAEHTAVRSDAGMFDVSHMTIIDVHGDQAEAFLQRLIANDVARLKINQALYGALLNERAGVLDDLIVYRLAWGFRCVVNASTRDKVLAWMQQHTRADAHFEHKPQIMIAVQGPNAVQRLLQVEAVSGLAELTPFYAMQHGDWLIGRTGYTGEDGVEIMLPEAQGVELWRKLREVGVAPAGLGARDTLRLEGGLNLYGQDLDEATSPLASNIGWTIAWEPQERDFIGRQALTELRETNTQKLTGLIMRDKGILRHGQAVHTNAGAGVITSGTYSPTLAYSIALARVPKQATGECEVDIRGTRKKAVLCKPPFVRNGTAMHP